MKDLPYITELKKSILFLEDEQVIKEKLLREQFYVTYESLKPVNLLKNTISDFISSPSLIDNSLSASIGIAAGLVSRKIIAGSGKNVIRKLMGTLVQLGVTQAIAQNPEKIKSIGQYILNNIFNKGKQSET